MTGWARASVLLALAGVLVAPAAHADPDGAAPSSTLFTIDDGDVFESSGLVDQGRVVLTTNDSGDDAVLYGLDPHTGRTVSHTTYADSVEDVEALAPGDDGTVWAGDIGDNRGRRDDVSVYLVRPLDGDHPGRRYRLRYPDGPHDAETLLVQPGSGRVFVVSKSVFGGTVYAAPAHLREGGPAQPMRAFAQVAGLVTDGTFFADGTRVLLRTYGTASVYTFPGFDLLGSLRLPAQPQGEGISMSADGRVLVSSEGLHTDVLRVRLPVSLTGASTVPATPPGPTPSSRPPQAVDAPPPARSPAEWGWTVLAAVVVAAVGWLSLRGSRLRGPRRR